ncbi:hypothetical protein BJV82DRAFT_632649 [Fennellomyces sp. T-0311]|nr:hypothetical protein BJV82DRAFT_632649 [Fennellomyces sp. T-0311]
MVNATVQWVYSAGSSWAPLDQYTQQSIEALWSHNACCWLNSSPSFGGHAVFIDTSELTITCSGYAYTIARRYEHSYRR